MGILQIATGAAAGYVLGAKAGRERYEQIAKIAGKIWGSKPVMASRSKARDTASSTYAQAKEAAAEKFESAKETAAEKFESAKEAAAERFSSEEEITVEAVPAPPSTANEFAKSGPYAD